MDKIELTPEEQEVFDTYDNPSDEKALFNLSIGGYVHQELDELETEIIKSKYEKQ